MAESTPSDAPLETEQQVDTQAREQTGQQQVRLRVDDSKLTTTYANAFRTHVSSEEVILDVGMNLVLPGRPGSGRGEGNGGERTAGEIQFDVTNRIVMNYYTAKRLAMVLSRLVRQHEERFGELKLNAAERTSS